MIPRPTQGLKMMSSRIKFRHTVLVSRTLLNEKYVLNSSLPIDPFPIIDLFITLLNISAFFLFVILLFRFSFSRSVDLRFDTNTSICDAFTCSFYITGLFILINFEHSAPFYASVLEGKENIFSKPGLLFGPLSDRKNSVKEWNVYPPIYLLLVTRLISLI